MTKMLFQPHPQSSLKITQMMKQSQKWETTFLANAAVHSQTPNIRPNLVARGTDMMATPNATPKIRCEIENVALNCGFFSGRWGDNGRFAAGDDRGRLACRVRLPVGDIFGRRAARGEDV
ncbi:hypothetical protein C2845_PM11G13520 [Panicum miliaceum]|uniref:Uncharacterized protein n=1 Tax=Panicum miliaceum TaxID=4540 RepID=A0A3L6RWM7_PANMI|nr:hypothetical protein C2845_PM11G13520 [Panicum miliaceum]